MPEFYARDALIERLDVMQRQIEAAAIDVKLLAAALIVGFLALLST